MKRAMLLVGILGFGMLVSQNLQAGGEKKDKDKDKVHEVGKGLTIKGKLSADVKDVVYKVKLEEGTTYVIHMHSDDQAALDPYLYLNDKEGKQLAEDDDSGGGDNGLDAQIDFECKTTGTYQVVASSYQRQGTGEYVLKITPKKKN